MKSLQLSCILNATHQLSDQEKSVLLEEILKERNVVYYKQKTEVFNVEFTGYDKYFWSLFRFVKHRLNHHIVTENHYIVYMDFCKFVLSHCKMTHAISFQMGGIVDECNEFHRLMSFRKHIQFMNQCVIFECFGRTSFAKLTDILFDIVTKDLDFVWIKILLFLFGVELNVLVKNRDELELFQSRLKENVPNRLSDCFTCIQKQEKDSFYLNKVEEALSVSISFLN